MPDTPRPGQPFHSVAGHFPYHQYPHPTDHSHEAAPMTPEQIAPVGLAYPKSANGTPLDHDDDCAFAYGNSGYACYCFVPRAHLDTVTAAVLPYVRHGATCALQAVRDNAPDDELCTCGLREVWQHR